PPPSYPFGAVEVPSYPTPGQHHNSRLSSTPSFCSPPSVPYESPQSILPKTPAPHDARHFMDSSQPQPQSGLAHHNVLPLFPCGPEASVLPSLGSSVPSIVVNPFPLEPSPMALDGFDPNMLLGGDLRLPETWMNVPPEWSNMDQPMQTMCFWNPGLL